MLLYTSKARIILQKRNYLTVPRSIVRCPFYSLAAQPREAVELYPAPESVPTTAPEEEEDRS
jgi:hypothetical protein